MTDEIKACYQVLDLEPGASPENVRQAYLELLKVWHPDRFPDPKFHKRATEKTKALNEAYERITAYLSGTYTESRASARARAGEEEAKRAKEAAEARFREEARLREEENRRQERAEREKQKARTQSNYSGGALWGRYGVPGAAAAQQQPQKKKTHWMQYIALAAVMAWFAFMQPKCDSERRLDKTKSAAEAGDASAQRVLGQHYEGGDGVQQNHVEAAEWYLKAAARGDVWAQSQLGWMYDTGKGVPQNHEEAFKWYSKAAEQGNSTAQENLGVLYHNGQAVPRDIVEAYKWYCIAAAQGNTHAVTNRDNLLRFLTPEQISEGQRRAAAASFEMDFYHNYPDLRPYGPLVDAVAQKLQASGYKSESREAVMEAISRAAREEISRNQQTQPPKTSQAP